jgi:hypothetical protein
VKRVPAVKPFQLCYNGAFPLLKRPVSYDVPAIDLELAGATRNWTVFNNNYLVQVDGAMCVGILEMGSGGMPVDGEPAVVIGGKTMENNLLVFDLEKGVLGFSMLLDFQHAVGLSALGFEVVQPTDVLQQHELVPALVLKMSAASALLCSLMMQ